MRIVLTVLVAMLTMAQVASAHIILNFGTEFSGEGGSLSGPVVVTIIDGAVAGDVDVTIDATGLDGSLSEYISGLYLNLNPAIIPATLGTATDGVLIPDPVLPIGLSANFFTADGDGDYDILINYPNQQFNAGMMDVVTFSLAGLVEGDFDFLSQDGGGHGPFVAVLRARSLDNDGEGSGWFFPTTPDGGEEPMIPEPASLVLWSLGAVALAGFGWRRRRRVA